MAWEKRPTGSFYYQSYRDPNGRVRKRYIGRGPLADITSESDNLAKEIQVRRRKKRQQEEEQYKALTAPLLAFIEVVDEQAAETLKAAGFHRYGGEWRHKRGKNEAG
jgi:hypothetical protein